MATCSALTAAAFYARVPVGGRRATASVHVNGRRGPRVSGVVRCSAGQGSGGISGKLAELWEAARGAPPGAVLAAAAAAVYKVASGLLVRTPPSPRRREEHVEAVPPAPEPVEVGEITEEELRPYDGSDPEKPLLMAIKGQIYDVSQSSDL